MKPKENSDRNPIERLKTRQPSESALSRFVIIHQKAKNMFIFRRWKMFSFVIFEIKLKIAPVKSFKKNIFGFTFTASDTGAHCMIRPSLVPQKIDCPVTDQQRQHILTLTSFVVTENTSATVNSGRRMTTTVPLLQRKTKQ